MIIEPSPHAFVSETQGGGSANTTAMTLSPLMRPAVNLPIIELDFIDQLLARNIPTKKGR
jgi:hypothetical protein